ncbi:MAG: glutaredoxin domain-containing protein [Anaerolineales bacterium]|nr:glutaredoxin domain-containing protein [Anaerolineales bacterium]
MSDSNAVIIYATEWCFDCRRARKFFDLHQIPYEWVNIDRDPKAEQYVLKVNRGMRSVPTIVFNDGSILVEPNDAQLADKLGLNKS